METCEEKVSEVGRNSDTPHSSSSSTDLRRKSASPLRTKLHENLSSLLTDPLATDFILKFKKYIIEYVDEAKVKNKDSLIKILPALMKYALQLYSFNSLMDTVKDSKDYIEFVSLLLLEYLKAHFLQCKIIGNETERKITDVILTYLYRNEGAVMDLLLKLTFWVENSLKKSHIHLENLFKLTSHLYLTLIVHNRVYLDAQHANITLLNYIRALFLFKVLKHLETECNSANASSEVQVEDVRIDSKIKHLVLNVLPIHPQLESVLGLLGRVFPETKLSLFRAKMKDFLITYDYYLFERIAGLLDFEHHHATYIDLKGNVNLRPMQDLQQIPIPGG